MKTATSLLTISALLLTAFPALAADGPRILTRERNYDPCGQVTGRDKLRCESRQREIVETADDVRAQRNLDATSNRAGLMRLRLAERERRAKRNAELAARRRTIASSVEDTDLNTRRVDYLQEYRRQTLECMRETTPRTRSRCLERARNNMRAEMKSRTRKVVTPDTREESEE